MKNIAVLSKENLTQDYPEYQVNHVPDLSHIGRLANQNPDIIILDCAGRSADVLRTYMKVLQAHKQKNNEAQPLCIAINPPTDLQISGIDHIHNGNIHDLDLNAISEKQQPINENILQLLTDINAATDALEGMNNFCLTDTLSPDVSDSKLDIQYQYKNTSLQTYFQEIRLSVSHTGVLLIKNNLPNEAGIFLIGYIDGLIHGLHHRKSLLLHDPQELIYYLYEQLMKYEHFSVSDISMWYAVMDISSGTLTHSTHNTIDISLDDELMAAQDSMQVTFGHGQSLHYEDNCLALHISQHNTNQISYGMRLIDSQNKKQAQLSGIKGMLKTGNAPKSLELGIECLWECIQNQMQFANDLYEHNPKQIYQTNMLYWLSEGSVEISVRLDKECVPWCYQNAMTDFFEDLDSTKELYMYWDSVEFSSDGYEISLRYMLPA